jgi:hypothetical protein
MSYWSVRVNKISTASLAATLLLVSSALLCGLASAENTYSKTGVGSSYPPGSPLAVNNSDYEDKNGDGCLEAGELKPGSQLEKRLKTRDANNDGKLCKDEYFFE